MPAVIKSSEIEWARPIWISFGFTGVEWDDARNIMKKRIAEAWEPLRRPKQCVYVIRVSGAVAIDYPLRFSPVVYIGEGRAFSRLSKHTKWLTSLVLAVPQLSVEVHIAQIARRNRRDLYKHVEADLLREFSDRHGALPWFNKQWEKSREWRFDYEPAAWRSLTRPIGLGAGNKFVWAIKPTKNNDQYAPYARGRVSTAEGSE